MFALNVAGLALGVVLVTIELKEKRGSYVRA
jgi:hypothetical protein